MENQTNFKKSTEVNLIDLKQKLAEIEVRKKIEKFEKHLSSFDTQPSYYLVLANLKLQIKDVEGMIRDKLNVIIISPLEPDSIVPIIEKAYDQGIPIILIDRKINSNKYNLILGQSSSCAFTSRLIKPWALSRSRSLRLRSFAVGAGII